MAVPPPVRLMPLMHDVPIDASHIMPQPPQLLLSCATHAPPQQSCPRLMPEGAAHSDVPQRQRPMLHVVPPGHIRPHMPQFASSIVVSTHAPPQQPWPVPHAMPVVPQPHMPIVQVSPLAQACPIIPQLAGSVCRFTHCMVPVEPIAQTALPVHDGKLPQRQLGVPAGIDAGVVHALAFVASHAMPQPLQFMNDGSVRPSVPGATERAMQVVPQQRWVELHVGVHMPVGPASTGGGRLPSTGGGVPPSPVRMQMPMRHVSPATQRTPHIPQLFESVGVFAHAVPPVAVAQHIWNPLHVGVQVAVGRRSSLEQPAKTTEASRAAIKAALAAKQVRAIWILTAWGRGGCTRP